jgi:hypothetical protein
MCKDEALVGLESEAPVLLTDDYKSWGYFLTENGRKIVVGYANIGLTPQAICDGDTIFAGINEILVGLNSFTLAIKFTYKLPWLFHEFISSEGSLLVRDELGFVKISRDGQKLWEGITEGIIEDFEFNGKKITGSTVEGEDFSFIVDK